MKPNDSAGLLTRGNLLIASDTFLWEGRGGRESIRAGKCLGPECPGNGEVYSMNFHLPFDEILLKLGTKYEDHGIST